MLTAQQRVSAFIVAGVPILLIVILVVGWREYTSYLLTTRIGHVLLAVAFFNQILGAYFIRRIVAIEV